jgi:hypothetical protein
MLLITGVLVLALGLLSGVVLVLAALGVIAAQVGYTLWVAFPLLCLAGFAMIATQAGLAQVRQVSRLSSALLLALALASVFALVLGAAALIPAPVKPGALWFVLGVGALLGSTGAASFAQRGPNA